MGPRPVHAITATNIITNPSFEQGLANGVPIGWDIATCEGVPNATVTLDNSRWVDGNQSAKVFTGPLENTFCFSSNTTRTLGFVQFRQFLTQGLTFSNLTDSTSGLSFWFYLQQYGNSTMMGGFEVRVFGAESSDELDYVFDPNPYVSYINNTEPGGGYRALLFNGYQPAQWYHFSRDLHADWSTLGLNMKAPFDLIQFEGLAIINNQALASETFWLDDVEAYAGPNPPPPQTHYSVFNFTDSNGNIVDNTVKWNLINWTGQAVPYTLGQMTLPTGPYYLHSYFRSGQQQYLILNQQIHLDSTLKIPLPMFPSPLAQGDYVVFNNTVSSASVSQPNKTTLQISVQGTIGTAYSMLLDTTLLPRVVLANGSNLNSGTDWTYDSLSSIAIVRFVMPATGQDDIQIFFAPRVSTLIKDQTGASVTTAVTVGTTVHDTTILAGATASAGGTVTYNLYSSNSCIGSQVASWPQTVTVTNSAIPDSPAFVTSVGQFSFEANYSGDSRDLPSAGNCESFTVTANAPTLSNSLFVAPITQNTNSVSAYDTATLLGATGPTGSITFRVFPDSACSGIAVFTDTVAVLGNGDYTSSQFTPTGSGAYYWRSSYGGDADNSPATSICGNRFAVFTTPQISFADSNGSPLSSRVTFRIVDGVGNIVPYAAGRILPTGSFFLEAYYLGYRVYRAPLNTGNTPPPILLEMLPTTYGYIALNSTATTISIDSMSNAKISFTITGGGPYLIVVNVPTKPLSVQINGSQTAAWTYNATSQTIAIEGAPQGSFQITLEQTASFSLWYLSGGAALMVIATVIGFAIWRRRKPEMSDAIP